MSKGTILVVDDEAHITHVVALKLRHAGYEVSTAGDGEEAYELACANPPSLVITDFQMPYMSGLALCLKLKATRATAGVPSIMLTARGHALDESDLKQTNIRLVMSKPFSPREVLVTVEEILRKVAAERDEPASPGAYAA